MLLIFRDDYEIPARGLRKFTGGELTIGRCQLRHFPCVPRIDITPQQTGMTGSHDGTHSGINLPLIGNQCNVIPSGSDVFQGICSRDRHRPAELRGISCSSLNSLGSSTELQW